MMARKNSSLFQDLQSWTVRDWAIIGNASTESAERPRHCSEMAMFSAPYGIEAVFLKILIFLKLLYIYILNKNILKSNYCRISKHPLRLHWLGALQEKDDYLYMESARVQNPSTNVLSILWSSHGLIRNPTRKKKNMHDAREETAMSCLFTQQSMTICLYSNQCPV